MDKEKYQYNWDKQEWDRLYTFRAEAVIMQPQIDGSYKSFTMPYSNPMVSVYRDMYRR
jgi:hypothetical protein